MICQINGAVTFKLRPSSSKNTSFRPSVTKLTRPDLHHVVGLFILKDVRPLVTPFSPCSHHRIIMKFTGVITNDRSDIHAKGQAQRSRSQRLKSNLAVSGL